MQPSDWEKFRSLTELFQSPMPGSPEEELERAVRAVFVGMRGRDGRAIDRDVQRGKVNPLRTVASKLAKAKRKGVPRAQVVKLEAVLREYIDRRWPEARDEFRGMA